MAKEASRERTLLRVFSDSPKSRAYSKATPANIYALYEPLLLHGEDPQGDCISPFIAKSRNRSTPLSISQRISSCALPKTEPAGDALQSTALRSADDGDDDDDMIMMMMINFLIITIHPGNIYALKRRFIYFSPVYLL